MPDSGNYLLANSRLINPVDRQDLAADLLIGEGVVKRIVPAGEPLPESEDLNVNVMDLAGKWLVPGLIDMHVHLREPGEEYKETIASGTRAAAAGGFTAVACMPNTRPVNDCQAVTSLIMAKAADAPARVYPVGAISRGSRGETLAEFGDMQAAGVVAVSDDGRPVTDSQLMRRALEYAANFGLVVISHAEDPALSRHGVMNEGFLSTSLGLKGIPRSAEEIMVYRDLALAGYTGLPVHIAHVSTAESINLIRRAKENGWPVTAETAPHYFSLTEEAVTGYNTAAKMNPPLRGPGDVEAVITGLGDGTIDAIATDHAPHSTLEKDVEFDLAANGIIGLETAVPLTLDLWRAGKLDEMRLVRLLSAGPAGILGVAGGRIAEGAGADLTVIDPEVEFSYSRDRIVSKSANTPFLDRRFRGKAVLTMMAGRITHNELVSYSRTA